MQQYNIALKKKKLLVTSSVSGYNVVTHCCRRKSLCITFLVRPSGQEACVQQRPSLQSTGISPASLSPRPPCFGSISVIVPPHYTSQINILYDGTIVWVCDKACQHRNEALNAHLYLHPSLSLSLNLSRRNNLEPVC